MRGQAGDAAAFGADAVDDVVFTSIIGMFSTGREAFASQHPRIFATIYKGSRLEQVLAVTFVRPDVAIVDTTSCLTDAPHRLSGVELIDGTVRTRLEQVMVKQDGAWRAASFHDVAIRPPAADGVPPPASGSSPR